MRNMLVSLAAATLVAGCAGASAGPMFEYGPSEGPLRYQISGSTESVVETPMGAQNQGGTIEATVTVEIGEQVSGGRSVTVVYEELAARGAMGSMKGGDLLGKPFVGVLDASGEMSFTETPKTPSQMASVFDPSSFVAQMLMPTPASSSPELQSWPVYQEATERTELPVTSTFEGTATIMGDTVWNGIAAKIVLMEGEFQMEGTGTPTGSPAELDLVASGSATARFIWDAARGVMLASSQEGSGVGTVDIPSMDLTMPMSVSTKQTIELQR